MRFCDRMVLVQIDDTALSNYSTISFTPTSHFTQEFRFLSYTLSPLFRATVCAIACSNPISWSLRDQEN